MWAAVSAWPPSTPIVEAFKAAGNKVITIMGARNKDLLILEDKMAAHSDELIICTDDGIVRAARPW